MFQTKKFEIVVQVGKEILEEAIEQFQRKLLEQCAVMKETLNLKTSRMQMAKVFFIRSKISSFGANDNIYHLLFEEILYRHDNKLFSA